MISLLIPVMFMRCMLSIFLFRLGRMLTRFGRRRNLKLRLLSDIGIRRVFATRGRRII